MVIRVEGFRQQFQRGLVSFKVTLALGSASVALVSGLVPVAWWPDSTTPAESLSPRKVTSQAWESGLCIHFLGLPKQSTTNWGA